MEQEKIGVRGRGTEAFENCLLPCENQNGNQQLNTKTGFKI